MKIVDGVNYHLGRVAMYGIFGDGVAKILRETAVRRISEPEHAVAQHSNLQLHVVFGSDQEFIFGLLEAFYLGRELISFVSV